MRIVFFFGCFGRPASQPARQQVWCRLGLACGVLKRGDEVLVAGVFLFIILYIPIPATFSSPLSTLSISVAVQKDRALRKGCFSRQIRPDDDAALWVPSRRSGLGTRVRSQSGDVCELEPHAGRTRLLVMTGVSLVVFYFYFYFFWKGRGSVSRGITRRR